jgi:hypothetical protein
MFQTRKKKTIPMINSDEEDNKVNVATAVSMQLPELDPDHTHELLSGKVMFFKICR